MNEIEMTMNDMIQARGLLARYERSRQLSKKSGGKIRRHIRQNYNSILRSNSIIIF